MQKVKYVAQWKAVLFGERNVQTVVCCRRLQLEIERPAKSLSQRQSPRLVDSPAEWRVNHKLHPAALVEKPLRNNCLLRGHRAQHGTSANDVPDQLLRRRVIDAALRLKPFHRSRYFVRRITVRSDLRTRDTRADRLPQIPHSRRQLGRPRRRLTQPERHARRRATCIFNLDSTSRRTPPHPPRSITQ